MTVVSTTPVQLNDGSASLVRIGNNGSPGRPVTLTWGLYSQVLQPGFGADIHPNGNAVSAVTSLGSTTLTVDLTGVQPGPGGTGALLSVSGRTGDVTTGQLASDLSGTFGPGSDTWLKAQGGSFGFAFATITATDSATGLPTAGTIRWTDGVTGAFTGTIDGGSNGYSGYVAVWAGSTTKTLTATGITYDANGTPIGPTGLAIS